MNKPKSVQIEAELNRVIHKRRRKSIVKSTLFTLATVASVAVLVATLWLPILQIYGSSMTPTLHDGEIVFSAKSSHLEPGDIVAFYYNNTILVKRVIARAGEWIDIDEEGNVYVNEQKLDEPYLTDKAFGDCDIALPYQVPESRIFVMGDHRSTSVDSRSKAIGCVANDQIVGKVVFRIWPLRDFGIIE